VFLCIYNLALLSSADLEVLYKELCKCSEEMATNYVRKLTVLQPKIWTKTIASSCAEIKKMYGC
jgi:hypothetical protein